LLRREGWAINHKRVLRLYREEGLMMRTKRRRKLAARIRVLPPLPETANEHWSIDFVSDQLATGHRFRAFTAVDRFTRECLCLEAGFHLPAQTVTRALDVLVAQRGRPKVITLDNGTEFMARHFDAWAHRLSIRLDFIAPGKPVQNAYIETFNGKLRDECLNQHWFASLGQARGVLEAWREDFNKTRPHSSLGDVAPELFRARWLAARVVGARPHNASFQVLDWTSVGEQVINVRASPSQWSRIRSRTRAHEREPSITSWGAGVTLGLSSTAGWAFR
jgi:putative transposase